jgi:hypothetical protein
MNHNEMCIMLRCLTMYVLSYTVQTQSEGDLMAKRYQPSKRVKRKVKGWGQTSIPFGPRSKFAMGDGSLETVDRSKPQAKRMGFSSDFSLPELSRGTPGNEDEDP